MRRLKAQIVADDLGDFLNRPSGHLARVHSVFPHAINLHSNTDALITLTTQDEITPMGLIVDKIENLTQLMAIGDEVVLEVNQLTAVNGTFQIDLQSAPVWLTSILVDETSQENEDVSQSRNQLVSWLAKQPALGLLPLLSRLTHGITGANQLNDNLYSRYIADDLEAFERAIFTSDWKTAVELTDKLVGFGMGLTPSCDDFLTAFLVVFWCAGELRPGHYPWVSQFNQAVARTAKKQTTLISANMLGHAMNGKICRSHQQLVRACLFNHNEDLILLASQVMRHGASSGADFMLGLVCALDWYCQSIMDFPMEGEQAWVESLPSQAIQSQPVPII